MTHHRFHFNDSSYKQSTDNRITRRSLRAVLPKSRSPSLEPGADPYPAEAAAPSTSETESHSAEQSDRTTRTTPIGICIPHIQMFYIHAEIPVLRFVEPANLITLHFSD